MKVATAEQMRMIDDRTQTEWGIPADLLMERAALEVSRAIKKKFPVLNKNKIVIFCGKGNNGGDGLALARILNEDGADVLIVLANDPSQYRGLAQLNLQRAKNYKIQIKQWEQLIPHDLDNADLLIDALLGTGVQGPPQGAYQRIIHEINLLQKPVIAIDVPTGVDVNTGRVWEEAVLANETVTFGVAKPGLLVYPGAEYAGEVRVVSIGFPKELLESDDLLVNSLMPVEIARLLPKREIIAHKGTTGHTLLIAGSTGMTGAAAICAQAALRTGSGLVSIGLRDGLSFPEKPPEAITISWDKLQSWDQYRVIVFGPGLTTADDGVELLATLLKNVTIPLVIDADGLNILALRKEWLKFRHPVILTPHPGEMARLTSLSVTKIQENRLEIATNFAKQWNAVIVLKGARTVIAFPDGRIYINISGNPGMATAGMGDALAGIIGGLIAQGLKYNEAAVVGAYLHGLAGDLLSEKMGPIGYLAGDLVLEIPNAIKKVNESE